jgi:molybdopterin converting factor small subunit
MIDVRLYANLTRTADKAATEFQVDARQGLTVKDVVDEGGIRVDDVRIVLVNGRTAELDSPLSDGDRVGLFPAISGG